MMQYDFIGDIHGYATPLKQLLLKLGYSEQNNSFSHPNRTVIFIGDYIDRGPEIPETLGIVKSMVDAGNAVALMGNHEYNALCYHTPNGQNSYLREHTENNRHQHQATLDQFKGASPSLDFYLDWFLSLPLFLDHAQFKAVHACWDVDAIQFLQNTLQGNTLDRNTLFASAQSGSSHFHAVEQILKGPELGLPHGNTFIDEGGKTRTHYRTAWWLNPFASTYHQYAVDQALKGISTEPIDDKLAQICPQYPNDYPPVFFGHYWLKGEPKILKHNVCCVDYSVAKENGVLVAYSWNGEMELQQAHFTSIKR